MANVPLTELQAKELVAEYGVPVTAHRLVRHEDELAAAAAAIGYPAVVKAIAPSLLHKSDAGGVALNIGDAAALGRTYAAMRHRFGGLDDFSGIAVETMAKGRFALILGAKRDPVFDIVLMVGAGGVDVEVRRDVALGVAPLEPADLAGMLDSLAAAPLYRGYRGQPGGDADQVYAVLAALQRLMAERPDVQEVEINPFFWGARGEASVAVDARVILAPGARPPAPRRPRLDQQDWDKLVRPRAIAVVGASATREKLGGRLLHVLRQQQYSGQLYPVNPGSHQINGLTAYPSVDDLPPGVDMASVIVPADQIPACLESCAKKGIRHGIIFSSGFEGPGGAERLQQIQAIAARWELKFTGPNCVGVVNFPSRIFNTIASPMVQPLDSVPTGPVAMVSQSGAMGEALISAAWDRGRGFNLFISTGNESILTVEDCLQRLAEDPETQVVALFLEAAKQGEQFIAALRELRRRNKPVVVFKVGSSQVGQLSVRSHTGSLAGEDAVYDAVFRKTGAFRVRAVHELADVSTALTFYPPMAGRRVAIVSGSGGACSVAADLCEQQGLLVPALSAALREGLQAFMPPFASTRNPIDATAHVTLHADHFAGIAATLLASDEVDAVMLLLVVNAEPSALKINEHIHELYAQGPKKPLLVCHVASPSLSPNVVAMYRSQGIPYFESPERCVAVLRGLAHFAAAGGGAG